MKTLQIRIKFWFDCKIFKVCIILAFWSYDLISNSFFLLPYITLLVSNENSMLYEEEKPTADKYSRRLFTEYYVDIGKRSNMFLTSVFWRF